MKATLQIDHLTELFTIDSRLLGEIPELDSMAVLTIITELEERFEIEVMDDEISAETFDTVGTLLQFIEQKIVAQ